MSDKHNKPGKGKPAVSQGSQRTGASSQTGSSSSAPRKAPATSAAAQKTTSSSARTTSTQTASTSRSNNQTTGQYNAGREEKSGGGGWIPPVALLFGLVGTLLSAFLWSKLNSLSSSTTTAMAEQREETSSKIADAQTQLTASIEEKNAALDEKIAGDLSSFNEEMRSNAQTDKEEVSTATAETLQEFTSKSEDELNTISTSFNVGIRTLREDVESRFTDSESKVTMMQETLQTTNELANRGQRDWILAEVEYLLRTGHHRVKLAGDVKAGVLALESANDRLHALGDIDYFPVREQIKQEVTELRRIGTPNIEGLIFRLETASKVADSLPLKASEDEAGDAAAEGGEQAEGGSAIGGLLSNLNFSVTSTTQADVDARRNSSRSGGAPNKQQISASEALSTHLQAARLSALRADSERFMLHMDNALKYTGDVFDGEENSVKDFVADLEDIRETNIVPNVPILGSALSVFEKIDAKRSEK